MDQKALVKKISATFTELSKKDGELSLVMLSPSSLFNEKTNLSLTVSASWLNQKTPKTAIKYISDSLKKHIKDLHIQRLINISIIHTDDDYVKNMNNSYNIAISNEPTIVGSFDASGNFQTSLLFISKKI